MKARHVKLTRKTVKSQEGEPHITTAINSDLVMRRQTSRSLKQPSQSPQISCSGGRWCFRLDWQGQENEQGKVTCKPVLDHVVECLHICAQLCSSCEIKLAICQPSQVYKSLLLPQINDRLAEVS